MHRYVLSLLSFLCLVPVIETSAHAAVVTIDGTIKSVDTKNWTITVQTGGGEKTLDVNSKAKISIEGKDAALDSLKPGQKVKLSYHDGLQIVLKIDLGMDDKLKASPLELVALHEINTPEADLSPWVSSDGLTIYWSASVPGRSQTPDRKLWIWSARRRTQGKLFEEPKPLVQGFGPTLTADQLEMILMQPRSDGGRGQTLYATTRDSVQMLFGRPQEIAELRSKWELWSPCLSSDGLTLYFVQMDFLEKRTTILVTTRQNRLAKWSMPQPIHLSLPDKLTGFFMWPSISNDDLTLLCSIQKSATDLPRFVALTRRNIHAPFTKMTNIEAPGITEFHGFRLRYVTATNETFFFSTRRNEGENWDLWMIKNFTPTVDGK